MINAYDVVIGDVMDGATTINHVGTTEHAGIDTPDILDCNSFRYFWVSWLNNTIRVGKGTEIFEDEVLHLISKENTFPVRGVAITTYDSQDRPGQWIFSKSLGKIFFYLDHYSVEFLTCQL